MNDPSIRYENIDYPRISVYISFSYLYASTKRLSSGPGLPGYVKGIGLCGCFVKWGTALSII